jgi:hypothetical protein
LPVARLLLPAIAVSWSFCCLAQDIETSGKAASGPVSTLAVVASPDYQHNPVAQRGETDLGLRALPGIKQFAKAFAHVFSEKAPRC